MVTSQPGCVAEGELSDRPQWCQYLVTKYFKMFLYYAMRLFFKETHRTQLAFSLFVLGRTGFLEEKPHSIIGQHFKVFSD